MEENEWLDTGRHSRCPACKSVDGLKVRRILQAVPAALSGSQPKVAAREGWEYRCDACGASGEAQLKTAEEQGKWVDGLGDEPYE